MLLCTGNLVLACVSFVSAVSTSGKRGAVVTEVGQCSEAGVGILKEGGNAADAVRLLSR